MPTGFSYSWKYTWTESLPGSVIRSCPTFLPSLRSAGGYPQKGGLGSWRCARGPGRCTAAEGRNEPTGSADQLKTGRDRKIWNVRIKISTFCKNLKTTFWRRQDGCKFCNLFKPSMSMSQSILVGKLPLTYLDISL